MTTDQKGKELCNFKPIVECVEEVIVIKEEKEVTRVQIHMDFGNGEISEAFYAVQSEINQIQWRDKDTRCWLNPEFHISKIQRYLESDVFRQQSCAPKKRIYQFTDIGEFVIEGKVVFCTGREVIKPPDSTMLYMINTQQMNQCLDIDTEISEKQAASEMFNLVGLSNNPGRVMLAYKLVYLMWQSYMDVGVRPNFCVYLYGKTGTKKTTFSSFLTQMYDRSKGIASQLRLNASIPAIVNVLSEICDDIIILDDLCPAVSKNIRRQQEETFIEITRYIGDGDVPARMKGKKLVKASPKCGVIFTGEYLVGSGSDAARFLPVEMMEPDGEKLKCFQNHPLMVSTFYYFFMKWYIKNYREIVLLLEKWFECYRESGIEIHARLQETHFFLNTAYLVLLQYYYENNFFTEEEAIKYYNSFRDLLTILVKQQDKRVQQTKSESFEEKNYFDCIRVLFKNGRLAIANDCGQFDEKLHDGLIYRRRLYLRGEKISSYFPETDMAGIADSLVDQGVLETGKGSRTKQISSLNGMRFYVIPLSYLE